MATVSLPGLASGFPTQTYIETVMKAERIPYNKANEKKEINTAYKNVFSNLNTKLTALKDASTALRDLGSFSVNTATVSDATKMTVTAGDSALAGEYAVTVDNLAKQDVYQSKGISETDKLEDLEGQQIKLKILGSDFTDFTLRGTNNNEILTNLVKDINSTSGVGLSASLIQSSSSEMKLVLTSKETGLSNKIEFAFSGSDVSDALGLSNAQKAEDAKLTINGVEVTSASNSVKDAIAGVTMQLTAKGDATVKVTQDADKITSKVETFVKAYNDIINTIKANTKKSDKNSDGSLTLTLQGDSTLRTLRNSLGDWMNSIVGDTTGFKLLSDIGLEVDKGVTSASLMTGQITFDKEKFKEKLAADPEAVAKMFNAAPVTDGSGDTTFAGGIGYMFENNLKPWTQSGDGFMASRISAYDSDIKFLTKQMEDMDIRLNKRQASLERKFVQLETSMSLLNNQLSWMKTQTNTLTGSSSKS